MMLQTYYQGSRPSGFRLFLCIPYIMLLLYTFTNLLANVWPILNQLERTATPHSGQLT